MNDFYYLSHGGPGSGRYPLGSGSRPYQDYPRMRRNKKGISGYIEKKKEDKRRASEIKSKAKEDSLLANKDRILKSGSASEVSKYKGRLTNKELQDVCKRLKLEKQIDEMRSTELIDSQSLLNNVVNNLKQSSQLITTGFLSYNALARIYNAMVDDSKKLPVIRLS